LLTGLDATGAAPWYNVLTTKEFLMTTPAKVWNRSEIEALILRNDRAVERAMVSIWERQTAAEQVAGTVVKDNGMGFASWGSRNGTYYANWVQSGKHLSGKHLEKARKMAMYHAGQLTNIANGVLGKA